MTRAELNEWLEASAWSRLYWARIWRRSEQLDSDGCTAVPDWLEYTCREHDVHFRTHHTLYRVPITWGQSNYAYRVRIQQGSAFAGLRIPYLVDSFGFLSPVSWWRWAVLSVVSWRAWDKKISVEEQARRGLMITLCGPREFAAEFQEQYDRLTKAGHIVLSYNYSDEDTGELLDPLQRRRIDASDEIFVINPGGVIDEQTHAEIEYARTLGVPAVYLEPLPSPPS